MQILAIICIYMSAAKFYQDSPMLAINMLKSSIYSSYFISTKTIISCYVTNHWKQSCADKCFLNVCSFFNLPNLYPLGCMELMVIVWDTWKWLLRPLLIRTLAPSKNIGKTLWHDLCKSSMVPGLLGKSVPENMSQIDNSSIRS